MNKLLQSVGHATLPHVDEPAAPGPRQADDQFLAMMGAGCDAETRRLGLTNVTMDVQFLVFLRLFARFGYFSFGPVAIDVRVIEEMVERTARVGASERLTVLDDDLVQFSRVLSQEVRKSGRKRIDELHYLLALMRWGRGLPGRVFGELGVTPEDVERYARERGQEITTQPDRLYTPEEAADYLGVHVQTVRAWIRSGRLRASRLTGQRALRIRAADLQSVLEPVDPGDV